MCHTLWAMLWLWITLSTSPISHLCWQQQWREHSPYICLMMTEKGLIQKLLTIIGVGTMIISLTAQIFIWAHITSEQMTSPVVLVHCEGFKASGSITKQMNLLFCLKSEWDWHEMNLLQTVNLCKDDTQVQFKEIMNAFIAICNSKHLEITVSNAKMCSITKYD